MYRSKFSLKFESCFTDEIENVDTWVPYYDGTVLGHALPHHPLSLHYHQVSGEHS